MTEELFDHLTALFGKQCGVMTTYQALAQRIRGAANLQELTTREDQCTRNYNLGTITVNELSRLDNLITDKFTIFLDKLQTNTTITTP
jgi:hypothetical protein